MSPPGLTTAEAAERLARFGPNRMTEEKRGARLRELLHTLADPMALMLVAAGAIYLALGETRDGALLLGALVPVLGVDVLLEARARGALAKLSAAVAPRARVLRDGEEREVPTDTLVPGDLLLLADGDVVHADAVVREARNLALDESTLTGESEPQDKRLLDGAPEKAADEERVWAGSLVLAGQGRVEVVATGMRTRYGKIAALVSDGPTEETPIQRRTGAMVRKLVVVAAVVAVAVVGLEILRGERVWNALLGGLSLTMAALPEEFPLVYTLFLSLGAWRLGRRGVLVRRLAAVETLGSTTVICVDKTGTLTAGRFALDVHLALGGARDPDAERTLLEAAVLACEPEPADPLERAIVAHATSDGVDAAELHRRFTLIHDYPFDPAGKHMAHVWGGEGGARIVAKGALEGILEHCAVEESARGEIQGALETLAAQGMRVLAVAERRAEEFAGDRGVDERALRLLGLLGFRDPLRPEVPAAVEACRRAGVAIKVITGDHALTAHAIAHAAGIPHSDEAIINGDALDGLSPEALVERVRAVSLFARVRPEQKFAIVDALRRAGEVVAMTGDGTNDAPALRRASIGVCMGQRGTEVARAAADLVLLRDDFDALVGTVREGRVIAHNIQRAFLYLIAFHLPVVGLALLAPLVGLPLVLLPVHLVWLELIVHPVSALVFEGEPPPTDVMAAPPRPAAAPLLPARRVLLSAISGGALALGALGLFRLRLPDGEAVARAAALAVVIAGSLALVWAERAGTQAWHRAGIPRRPRFWIVCLLVAASLPLLIEFAPTARALQVAPLDGAGWLEAIGVALAAVGWRAFGWGGEKISA